MNKSILIFAISVLAGTKQYAQLNKNVMEYTEEISYNKKQEANYISFKKNMQVNQENAEKFINAMILNNTSEKVAVFATEKDKLGYTHIKYNVLQNGVEILNKRIIAHNLNGKLVSLNGDLRLSKKPANSYVLNESQALALALKKVNAKKYMWENKANEIQMQKALKQPDFSYFPKAKKIILEKDGKSYYTYQFNIYAQEPLYRANVFVDGASGKVLLEQNLICNVNVPGTAATLYSGTQTITCDQTGSIFSLRETQRGLGIETFNLAGGTAYANTDFTNTSTSWTTTGFDQAATDAHWGAEKTYDYFMNTHSRNSIDNVGYKLVSFVHYSVTFNNAFWDGQVMTYGDGDGTQFTSFAGLDVCGHEITHGLVGNSAGLMGGEADALNESFADIFGNAIERYARPNNWDWKMGVDISVTGTPVRDMQNPLIYSHPDTYLGTNWSSFGEPHINAGPCNKWFYLLAAGGTGTNSINNSYTVTGLGNSVAELIAYRALTVYFTPSTDYYLARLFTIQAAKDLYGMCSNEVIQTINAWYAVGVGIKYIPGVSNSDFMASTTNLCTIPANVAFTNLSAIGFSYVWNFGDGSTSTSTNPAHTYTANGTYSVKLKTTGCANAVDSIVKTSYIKINTPAPPIVPNVSRCGPGSLVLNASGGAKYNWYASPSSTNILYTGSSYTTPVLTSNTTYYVVNTNTHVVTSLGELSNTVSAGAYTTNPLGGISFDVIKKCELISVDVYAQSTCTAIIEAYDIYAAAVVNSNTTVLNPGLNTVMLNFTLTPGTYNLEFDNYYQTAVYYNTGGTYNFPYSNGLIDLLNSSSSQSDYEYFYNWMVVEIDDCASGQTAVTASVVADCTGLSSYTGNSDSFSIYPNPASNNLTIKHNSNQMVTFLISDASGRIVLKQKINSGEENIQLGHLSNGMYLMSIKDETGNILKTSKLIKQ